MKVKKKNDLNVFQERCSVEICLNYEIVNTVTYERTGNALFDYSRVYNMMVYSSTI